jgi:hypothetical protein
VTAKLSLSNVKYTKAADGGSCPLTGTGSKETGSYSGQELLKASKEEQDKGMAMGKGKGTLCEEKVKTGCKKAFKNGEEVKASQSTPVVLTLAKTGNSINCQGSVVTAAIEDITKTPEPLEKFTVTFTQCKLNMTTNCLKVEMVNKNAKALVRNWAFSVGDGSITVPFTLFIECENAVVKCEYESKDLMLGLPGGDPATLTSAQVLENKKLTGGGDAGCSGALIWYATYTVEKPKPVYVAG